jgi:hypothetical protein
MLADVLIEYNQKVIIVCTDGYLAHNGRKNYGSNNVRDGRIEYLPLKHFLKRTPDPQIHVIFDEIDQMLGVNSLTLLDDKESKTTKAVFVASTMKEWKSVTGLSGTIE